MCRLFGQISLQPRDASDALIGSECSLLRQSNGKKSNPQRDGWGLGWYEGGRTRLVRSRQPAFKEADRLREAAERARVSKVVVGHLRAASNPLKLSKARLITANNCQPFTDGEWLFAHNGTLNIPREVAAALGPRARKLQGENDSEVWFQHFLKHLDRAGSFHGAMQAAILELWDIWDGCRKRHPGKQGPYTSLNVIASDGRSLFGLCHAAAKGLANVGIFHPTQPWSRMSLSRRADRVLLASEGVDRGPWDLFDPPETVAVSPRLTIERRPLAGLPQVVLPEPEALAR